MRTRLLNVLLLTALVLAVFRLWRFMDEPPPALPPINVGAPPPAAPATTGGQTAEVAELPPETYDVIVARDLFSPARGVVPPAPAAATKAAPKPQSAPKLTLSGVVIIDGEKTAFLQEGSQESRPRKVRENENFAGGSVKTIRPDGITFLFAGSEINVPLRKPNEGAGATPAGKTAPRAETPAAFPRRQPPTGVQQGRMPAPGRPVPGMPGMPAVPPEVPPEVDPGGGVFGDEEFPEGAIPGEEGLGMPEDETEN